MNRASLPGLSFSFISAALYVFSLITIFTDGLDLIIANNIIEALFGVLLVLIFLPFVIIILITGIAACTLVTIGTILAAAGPSFATGKNGKVGGILVIVGAAIGVLFSMLLVYTPMIVGVVGGILILANARATKSGQHA